MTAHRRIALTTSAMLAVLPLLAWQSSAQAAVDQPTGYSVHAQADTPAYFALAQQGGSTSVRTDLSWALAEPSRGVFDWTESDSFVRSAAVAGQRALLIVDQAPTWASGVSPSTPWPTWYPPRRASDYGAFIGQVLARYGTDGTFWKANPATPKVLPAGIEVWNEPNLAAFWRSGPDPAGYARLVRAAYREAKAVDPTIPVIAGALAGHGAYNDSRCTGTSDGGVSATGINPVNFLSRMYQAGADGYLDGVSVHPYRFWQGATATQMLAYHRCSAWSQISQTPVSIRSVMRSAGDSTRKVWITEAGAPTCVTGAAYTCVSEEEQARLAAGQVGYFRDQPWHGGYYWYDLRDDANLGTNPLLDAEQHFGAVRADNSPKPAYAALRTAYSN